MTPIPAAADGAPPPTLAAWFRANAVSLAVTAAAVAVVCYFLQPLDVLIAALGLSLIIFIHELGHFAAAKLCDVHVKTFSIGFGPALPFCQFRYGETTYKLAMIPLGGFVAMVGEGDTEGDVVDAEDPPPEDPPPDPRSFRNKPVWQRMIIISAGVIMNVLLGAVLFVITYMHGVEEKPAIVYHVEPGSAAWRVGLKTGTEIRALDGRTGIFFEDIRPVVSSTSKGETVDLVVSYRGEERAVTVEPARQEGALYPQLGITPPKKPTLLNLRRDETPPYVPGSAASAATGPDGGPGFRQGDRIVAMSDPADPAAVTPIDPNYNGLPGEIFDYERRLRALAGQPVTFHVVRKGQEGSGTPPVEPVVVPPAYHKDTGLRMRMGTIVAVRRGSPAETAGIRVSPPEGEKSGGKGDEIVAVEVPEPDGSVTRFTADRTDGPADPRVRPLDPLRLPYELDRWADRQKTDRTVKVTVLRQDDHTSKRVDLRMEWDPSYSNESGTAYNPGTPTAVEELGLAYQVQALVDAVMPGSPAAAAGVKPNDQIAEVRFTSRTHTDADTGSWQEIRPHQWSFVDANLQLPSVRMLQVKVRRGEELVELPPIGAVEDRSWPVADRGLRLADEQRVQKADGIGEALEMGFHRTVRSIKVTYQSLYAMIFGRISVKMVAGPITLARASYLLAGEDVWYLLLLMALISINLAVVNFLPIPVLDGGHMMFLLYEAVRGKPAPESVQIVLTYVGLGLVLCLMVFVIGLDVWRLFIG